MTARPRRVDSAETRARIASAALALFQRCGFEATTVEQIAEEAGVGRRTVFHHFGSKRGIVLDHLVAQEDAVIALVRSRPSAEHPLTSLHAALRSMAADGLDRDLLVQIRAVLQAASTSGGTAAGQSAGHLGGLGFQRRLVDVLVERDPDADSVDLHAVAGTARGWFHTAVHLYFVDGDLDLVEYFDRVVATSVGAIGAVGPDLVPGG